MGMEGGVSKDTNNNSDSNTDSNTSNNIDYKEYLSIIYGDDIEVIFNTYIFIYNKDRIKPNTVARVGKLLHKNGMKLITEEIDDVARIESSSNIIGYAIFLKNQLSELFKIKPGTNIKDNIVIIRDNDTFGRGKIISQFYSKKHPEIILEYNGSRYIAKFNGRLINRFTPIGWRESKGEKSKT